MAGPSAAKRQERLERFAVRQELKANQSPPPAPVGPVWEEPATDPMSQSIRNTIEAFFWRKGHY
jgi:hypothetical protein